MRTIKGLILTLSLTVVFAAAAAGQTLVSLDGTRVNVNAQRGKVVVLSVGANWLPLSAKEADYTNTLVKKYIGKEVVFYFIATDSLSPGSKNFASNDALQRFATTNKLTIPLLRDPDGAGTYKRYGIDQVPSFVILDKNGVQSGPPFGGIDPKYDITIPISKEINKLLL